MLSCYYESYLGLYSRYIYSHFYLLSLSFERQKDRKINKYANGEILIKSIWARYYLSNSLLRQYRGN